MEPPPYPRIPYLWSAVSASSDDRVLLPGERREWLTQDVVVEEKLDGANVSVWWDGDVPRTASRGGSGAMDRAGQLGPLRARVFSDIERFRELLDGGRVLYAEWLWLAHSVHYDRLPDPLVALDVWYPGHGFASTGERDRYCAGAGIPVPPLLFRGVLETESALRSLLGPSAFGAAQMEGAVLRRADGRRCKVVADGFTRAQDHEIARRRNGVAST